MGGLFIDILVFFFVREFFRFFQFIRSMRWERITASVSGGVAHSPFWGCPLAQVHYRTGSNRGSQEECGEIPFILLESATKYAQKFSARQTVVVRVNPANKTDTLFFELDQK
jgi:hypothetical protein